MISNKLRNNGSLPYSHESHIDPRHEREAKRLIDKGFAPGVRAFPGDDGKIDFDCVGQARKKFEEELGEDRVAETEGVYDGQGVRKHVEGESATVWINPKPK